MDAIETAASAFLVACFLIAFGVAWRRSSPRPPAPDAQVIDLDTARLAKSIERHPSGNAS